MLVAVVVILLLNVFAIPAMQERSVEKTDYSTFLSNVERGNVSKAEVQDDYIYYGVRKNGEDVVCKTVRMDDPDLVSRLYDAGTSMEAVGASEAVHSSQSDHRLCDSHWHLLFYLVDG